MQTNTLAKIEDLAKSANSEIKQAEDSKTLTDVETKYLGRKAELTQLLRGIKDLDPAERGEVGKTANKVRTQIEEQISKRAQSLRQAELTTQLQHEFLDITLPGAMPSDKVGHLHPVTKELIRIQDIFYRMGFQVHQPYMIDDDYHNFTSLNIPEGHPARDMWDTIRVSDELVMITHTSSMQNRVISAQEPPVRAIVPGVCFRNEATDARHEHTFYQVEGIYVDKGIKLSDMLGVLSEFLRQYFERPVKIKIQPTYFPFVEPGLEILMECPVCHGAGKTGCGGCSGSAWMEVIPCGPIHPYVLREAGLDPNTYSGFAWGFGLERMIMVKYQVNDIRLFHSGRIDFINQF